MRTLLVVAVAAAVSGCEKAPPAETKPADSAPVATPTSAPTSAPTDSTTPLKADSAPAKAATKAEGPLRDSVIDAKFGVDEKGKVTPLKKP